MAQGKTKEISINGDNAFSLKERFQGYFAGIASGCTKMLVGKLSFILFYLGVIILLGHPFDTIKVRLQTENIGGRFQGPLHCLKTTIQKEGILALYKGSTPPLIGWAIIDSVQAGTYTATKLWIKDKINSTNKEDYHIDAMAGLVGGWVSSVVSTPVEQIKARLQVQYDSKTRQFKGPIDCGKQLISKYGVVKGLWNGFTSTLIFRSYFAIFWPTYHFTTNYLKEKNNFYLNSWIPFLSGGVAATVFWIFSFPSDVVKNRMMSQSINTISLKYPTVISCFKDVYKSQGLKGFYRGFLPAMLRSFPTNGAALMAYEFVMSF